MMRLARLVLSILGGSSVAVVTGISSAGSPYAWGCGPGSLCGEW